MNDKVGLVSVPDESNTVKVFSQFCTLCQEEKIQSSFAKIDKTGRRKKQCNTYLRARHKAEQFDITVEEFRTYSEGRCTICGATSSTKPYVDKKTGKLVTRLCSVHRGHFRAFERWDQLTLFKKISEKFPFWLKILKTNNLFLFNLCDE